MCICRRAGILIRGFIAFPIFIRYHVNLVGLFFRPTRHFLLAYPESRCDDAHIGQCVFGTFFCELTVVGRQMLRAL